METGLTVIADASAVLFGLVIVALEFAYGSALSRIEDLGEVRRYIWWVWSAGLNTSLYYIYSFVVSLHLLRAEFSHSSLLIMTIVFSSAMILTKSFDIYFLYRMSSMDWPRFHNLFLFDVIITVVISPAVFALVWVAVFQSRDPDMLKTMYIALKYTLVLASLRAVLLVALSFLAAANLEQMDVNRKTCPYCAERIKARAIKCRHCGSDIPMAQIESAE